MSVQDIDVSRSHKIHSDANQEGNRIANDKNFSLKSQAFYVFYSSRNTWGKMISATLQTHEAGFSRNTWHFAGTVCVSPTKLRTKGEAGDSLISSGVPTCSIEPLLNTTTWSAKSKASSWWPHSRVWSHKLFCKFRIKVTVWIKCLAWSWVTMIVVRPNDLTISFMLALSDLRTKVSKAPKGSSNSKSLQEEQGILLHKNRWMNMLWKCYDHKFAIQNHNYILCPYTSIQPQFTKLRWLKTLAFSWSSCFVESKKHLSSKQEEAATFTLVSRQVLLPMQFAASGLLISEKSIDHQSLAVLLYQGDPRLCIKQSNNKDNHSQFVQQNLRCMEQVHATEKQLDARNSQLRNEEPHWLRLTAGPYRHPSSWHLAQTQCSLLGSCVETVHNSERPCQDFGPGLLSLSHLHLRPFPKVIARLAIHPKAGTKNWEVNRLSLPKYFSCIFMVHFIGMCILVPQRNATLAIKIDSPVCNFLQTSY